MKLRLTIVCLMMLDQNEGSLDRLVNSAGIAYSEKVISFLELGIRNPSKLNDLVTRMNALVRQADQGIDACTGYLFTLNPTNEGFAEVLKQFTKNYLDAFDIYEEISNFIIEKPNETE